MENIVKVGLDNIKPAAGSKKKRKLLGRGTSSGHGKTCCRGSKGQTSRSGRATYPGFEGGQSPLIRRMPKRGFNSKYPLVYQEVNLESIAKLKETTITPALLWEKGIVKSKNKPVKILSEGQLKSALTVQAHAFSKSAEEKIKQAGGNAEVINA